MTVTFSTDFNRIDFDAVTRWLGQMFWSLGITREEVVFGARNSALVVGGFDESDNQVSFLRVISDRVRFAYLVDVIVAPEVRRQGIGKRMVRFALEAQELAWVHQWLLRSRDARGVYARVGFVPLNDPEHWMLIQAPRGDRSAFKAPYEE